MGDGGVLEIVATVGHMTRGQPSNSVARLAQRVAMEGIGAARLVLLLAGLWRAPEETGVWTTQ